MKNSNLYRAMMEQAEPPAHLQTNVLERVEELRHESEVPKPRPFVTKRHRPATTLTKVTLGLVAAVFVAAAVIAVPLLASNLTQNEGTDATPTFAETFGLALYADAAEPGQTVSIATDESGLVPWSGSGGATISTVSYRMNLTCTGEGIETITYRIEGDDVRFLEETWRITEEGVFAPDYGSSPQAFNPSQELTVDYTNQHPENLVQSIEVNVMTDEEIAYYESLTELMDRRQATSDPTEIAAIDNELQELDRQRSEREHELVATWPDDPDEFQAFQTAQFIEAQHAAADKLAKATFSVIATFTDGSTATKRYRIAPVENFDQVLLDRQGVAEENDPRLTASLFTITELG